MNEPAGLPPVNPTAPAKIQPWAIILIVIAVLCCFCIGGLGLLIAFGEPILHELGLYALLPVLAILP